LTADAKETQMKNNRLTEDYFDLVVYGLEEHYILDTLDRTNTFIITYPQTTIRSIFNVIRENGIKYKWIEEDAQGIKSKVMVINTSELIKLKGNILKQIHVSFGQRGWLMVSNYYLIDEEGYLVGLASYDYDRYHKGDYDLVELPMYNTKIKVPRNEVVDVIERSEVMGDL
jgi:hypothetical protein